MNERAIPTDEVAFKITRHTTGRAWSWTLRRGPTGLELIGPDGHVGGSFPTVRKAVASSQHLNLVRRTDDVAIECPVLDDEAVARMLVGRLGARCTINGWPWRWHSTADVVAFLPKDHRSHPRYEETVAELSWTCPSWPGSDWPDAGEVSLDRLGQLYWWTRTADGDLIEPERYLGRFDTLDEARIQLWDLLDARGYRLDWNGNPGQHPGGVMAFWSSNAREPLNDDSWKKRSGSS